MYKVRSALLALALGGAGTLASAPVADADRLPAPRQVTVRLTKSGVRAPDSLRAGRYRMEVAAPQAGGLLILIKPDQGYTRADLRADVRANTPAANRRFYRNTRYFGGADMLVGGSTGVLWETLYSGRYWLLGVTFHPGFSITTVHVHGTPSPSRFPRVSGSITTISDRGLDLARTVPQAGRLLIRNTGTSFSYLTLMPLARGATYDDFIRWVRHPRRDVPITFAGLLSTAPLTRDAGYVLRYRMHPGRYVAMDGRTLNAVFRGGSASNLRRVVRPLTVRRVPLAAPAGRRVQGVRAGGTGVDATAGWLTPRGARLLEGRGLAPALPTLPKQAAPAR